MWTSIGSVGTSSLNFRIKRDKKSAEVFILPGTFAIVRLNCNSKLHAFHNGGGINLVWKKVVTTLLYAMMILSFGDPQKTCRKSFNVNYKGKNLRHRWTFFCGRVKVIEPYATGA